MKKVMLLSMFMGIILCTAIAVADTPPGASNEATVIYNAAKSEVTSKGKLSTQNKEHTNKEVVETQDPALVLNKITFTTPELRKERLAKLVKAIAAIEDRGGKPLDRKQCDKRWTKRCDKHKTDADPRRSSKAYRYKKCLRKWKRCHKRDAWWTRKRNSIAEAALNAQEKTGVDATLLIAVGRMESDFRNLTLINTACKYGARKYNCYADCGMTQHHVRGSMEYVTRKCKQLTKSPKLSFFKSAQELARHVAYCNDPKRIKKNLPTRRCILNRYNQGTFYRRAERCSKCWINPKRFGSPESYRWAYAACKKTQRKCRHRAAYWKKVTCFEYGARQTIRSKRSCRRCYSLAKIRTQFYVQPQTGALLTSFLFKKPSSK